MKQILFIFLFLATSTLFVTAQERDTSFQIMGNPIITHKYTADPAALVYNDKVYLYTGHDQCRHPENRYVMNEWLVFSSPDLINWTEHPVPLRPTDFKWAKGSAWASQVIERNGKFYWYVTVDHGSIHGKAIGIAVADNPLGPFKDAIGSALITNDMTTEYTNISWEDIDPTVWIDNDGQAYLFWGNTQCYYIKLKENMIEADGPIVPVHLPDFTEAPWIHKRGEWYYLSYAQFFPEKIGYAMSKNITGPWEYKGILNEISGNSNTNHQAIIEFKNNWYFIYHNGAIPTQGGSFRRSVCIDRLYYNPDGTMKRVQMTSEGLMNNKDVYLFSFFTGRSLDGLHLAYSYDGLTWIELNNGNSFLTPQVGKDKFMRDPSIAQDRNGVFHMVWTTSWTDNQIGYASSKDLIHWSEQKAIPVMKHEPEARNTWAPEIFYDEKSELFYIFWASTITGRFSKKGKSEDGYDHRQYYVTTPDFKTFSETKLFFEPGFSVIDGAILPNGDEYLLFVKDETVEPVEKNIRVVRSKDLNNFPNTVSAPVTGDYWAEGPAPLQVGEYIYVYFDKYRLGKYGAIRSKNNGKTWEDVSEQVSFPKGTRHGTAFKVSKDVLNNLLKTNN